MRRTGSAILAKRELRCTSPCPARSRHRRFRSRRVRKEPASFGPSQVLSPYWPALLVGHCDLKTPAPAHAIRFAVPLPEGATFCEDVSLSPDGRKLLISVSGGGLWIRDLNALEWRRLPNTLGAVRPFWSPDSRFIAFPMADQIKKIDISGGPAQSLSTIAGTGGGAWNRDGAIIVGAPSGP